MATPQPKKSLSSVQMGQLKARATASTGQSSSSRVPIRARAGDCQTCQVSRSTAWTIAPTHFSVSRAGPGGIPRLSRIAGRCSRASPKTESGARKSTLPAYWVRRSRTLEPRTARIRMFASRTSTISSFDPAGFDEPVGSRPLFLLLRFQLRRSSAARFRQPDEERRDRPGRAKVWWGGKCRWWHHGV